MNNQIVKGCGYHHIALRVRDAKRSIQFYKEGLGFTAHASWGEGDKKITMLDMGDGGIIEIFGGGEKGELSEMCAGGYFHLALGTTDTDAAFQAAVDAGAKVKIAPKDVDLPSDPVMKLRIAFVYGPDGEIIEFVQNRE